MQTECPHCHTFFHVTDEQLQVAAGQVRCGKCHTVFTAEIIAEVTLPVIDRPDESPLEIDDIHIDELDDVEIDVGDISIPDALNAPELEPADLDNDELDYATLDTFESGQVSEQEQEHAPEEQEPEEHQPEEHQPEEHEPEEHEPEEHASGQVLNPPQLRLVTTNTANPDNAKINADAAPYADLNEGQISDVSINTARAAANHADIIDEPPALQEQASGYDPAQLYPELESATAPSHANSIGYVSAGLLLILIFILQGAYLLRENLAEHGLRPVMEKFCHQLNCDLALPRAPDSIALTRREVRSHPNINDALRVTATIINQADFRQAYPLLQIQFQNIEGQLIAGRDFLPTEYLPDDIDINMGIAPDKPVNIALELVDPGDKAVSFLFIFK